VFVPSKPLQPSLTFMRARTGAYLKGKIPLLYLGIPPKC